MNPLELFKDHFESYGFSWQPANPICSTNPKLLFNISGGVCFEEVIASGVRPPFSQIISCQPCLRTDNWTKIGLSGRHHFAFEMLGHFCLYNEGEAKTKQLMIESAWRFLTSSLRILPSRLVVTVHPNDYTTQNIWEQLGVGRISQNTGNTSFNPARTKCGFRTEIAWLGNQNQDPIELWNIVFTEFDGDKLLARPLTKIAADSGMCLDRILTAVEDAINDYNNSLWHPLVTSLNEMQELDFTTACRLADVGRAISWLLAEGVLPGNKASAYVLRKFIREAFALSGYNALTFDQTADLWLRNWTAETNFSQLKQSLSDEISQFALCLRSGEKACMRLLERRKGELTESDYRVLSESHGYPEYLARKQQRSYFDES